MASTSFIVLSLTIVLFLNISMAQYGTEGALESATELV